MRTTITLDDDVAKTIERLRRRSGAGLKEMVNEALRCGLARLEAPQEAPTTPYRTPSVSLGRCLLPGLDDVAEALAAADGEAYR